MALKDLITGGIGGLVESVGGVIDKFVHTKDEKAAVMLEIERIAATQASEIEQTVRAEVGAKERILVAELQQGDNFTKRARPMVVYAGLGFLLINNIIMPWVTYLSGQEVPTIELPDMFWAGWSGIVATWSIGRTFEKRGVQSKVTSIVTGSGSGSILD